jgi:hypothetical protein
MADRVGRQLVNGQDDIGGLVAGQARAAGMSVHASTQGRQHAGVERQVKRWRRTEESLTGHAHRIGRPLDVQISPDRLPGPPSDISGHAIASSPSTSSPRP